MWYAAVRKHLSSVMPHTCTQFSAKDLWCVSLSAPAMKELNSSQQELFSLWFTNTVEAAILWYDKCMDGGLKLAIYGLCWLNKKKKTFFHPHKVDEGSPSLPGHCVLTAAAADRGTFSNRSLWQKSLKRWTSLKRGWSHTLKFSHSLLSQLIFQSVYGQL